MRTRLFNFSTLCCVIALTGLVLACIFAEPYYSGKRVLSLHRRFHLSIAGPGTVPRLVMFNDRNAGPIGGGLYPTIAGDPKTEGFLNTAGIYYWHLRWRSGLSLWDLEVSLIYPIVLAAVLPTAWAIRHRRRDQRKGFPVQPPAAGV